MPDIAQDAISSQPYTYPAFSAITDVSQRDRIVAAQGLIKKFRPATQPTSNGVAIHSGPSADRISAANSSAMPPITESSLEQDFTVAGTPSKLDCPFASMSNRRLTSHAASIVSRYRPGASTPRSSVSRFNGRASPLANLSTADFTKPETCAMTSPDKIQDVEASVQGSTGVCPIRLLDQRPPEEVAAYFESHKHELPRSHEMCVKRYQSNEESIKQLDAKYGNIVSMIQGLGQKHVSMLPNTPGDGEGDMDDDHVSADKIRKWASSVDTSPPQPSPEPNDENDAEGEDRQPRFDRPLNDIRLGESPSRPWGIQVPLDVHGHGSNASSVPAVPHTPLDTEKPVRREAEPEKPRGKCPFGFDAVKEKVNVEPQAQEPATRPNVVSSTVPEPGTAPEPRLEPPLNATFLDPPPVGDYPKKTNATPQMVFTGPVFIGYSLEDATKMSVSYTHLTLPTKRIV